MVNMIAAGIVLFNPDKSRLNKSIKKIQEQFNKIYIFDNSEYPITLENDNLEYITENKNCGIAYALNRIMEQAKRDGYQWVVTMDQDSIIPDGLVDGFNQCISEHPEVAIVCPQVIDRRRSYMTIESDEKEVYIDFCITSASCTSIAAWEKCGRFDEWLFIDLVDNDFCKRIILSGYKIMRLNKWVLDQEFGKIIPKSIRKQKLWLKVSRILHNKNFAKFSYKKFVSPLRVYYTNRNILYLNKKFSHYGPVGYENYNCRGYWGFVISFMIPSILRAQNKGHVIKATIKGIEAGRRSNPGKWVIKKDVERKS